MFCPLMLTILDGQCLTRGKMPKQLSPLSLPRKIATDETDPEELDLDETDSLSRFGARLCKI